MNYMQNYVAKFNEAIGTERGLTVAFRAPELRAALIAEEAAETIAAIQRRDMVEVIDGLCDLLYVIFGTADAFGVDLDPFFAEVHASNMAKLNGGYTNAAGKFCKPAGWQPPRIAEMLTKLQAGE